MGFRVKYQIRQTSAIIQKRVLHTPSLVSSWLVCFFLSVSVLQAQYEPINIPQLKKQIKEAKADSTRARLYGILGWELRFTDHTNSEKIADKMIGLSAPANDYLRLAEAYKIKGFARVLDQKIPECLALYATAKEYAQLAKNESEEAHMLSLTAGMYQDKGDFDKAVQYYLEGLELAEKSKNPAMIATLANNLAEAYSDAGRPIGFVLPYYQKALKEETALENWQYVGMIYSNIAKDYMLAGNKALAEKNAALAIHNILRKNDRAYVYATVATDIGEMYAGLGKYAEAERFLKEGFGILDSIGTKDNKLIPLSALAKLYLKQNRTDLAERSVRQLLQLATAYKTKLFLRDAYKVLSALAQKQNQPAEALQYFQQYKNWEDSIYNEKRETSIANTELRLRLQQTELAIKYGADKKLKENHELKKSYIGLQNRSLTILVITILLLVLGLGLFMANRTLGQKNKELNKQKKVIEQQSDEKDTLIREINHRVKNNLQIISSLLNLQANSLTDPQAIEALRSSHKRVKAISLIHQKLYGNEETASVPMEEYIRTLFTDLRNLYGANHIKLEYHSSPNDIQLDMEFAVPVGLILNEVFTNAFKYAFTGRNAGILSVQIIENDNITYTIIIKDDGPGMPEGFDTGKIQSLGLRIIKELSRQLRGSFRYSNESGAIFTLNFPNSGGQKTDN